MTTTFTTHRPAPLVEPVHAGMRRVGLELALAPVLIRAWWAGKSAAGRRRAKALGLGGVVAGVVVLCTAAWWDPAIDAVFAGVSSWLIKAAIDATATAAEQFMSLAFNNPLTEISDAEWAIATRQAARWGAVFAVVAVAACALEVVAALIVRNATRVLRAGIVAALAWPMTVAAILALAELVSITDGLSGQMFDNVAGTGATGSAAAATAMGAAVGGLTALSVGGGWIVVLIGALVCIVGLVLIAMVMAARAFGLVVATGFAPTALMLVGFSGTRGMARKWVEIVLGLLLTKPLAAGIIVLCLELAGEGSLDSFIMGSVGLWVAVFSPGLAMSMVSFAGGQLSAALTAHAGMVKGAASQATQAGATRLALEGPNKEALSELGEQASGLAKKLNGLMGGLGSRLSDLTSRGSEGEQVEDEQPEPPEDETAPAPVDASDSGETSPDGAGETGGEGSGHEPNGGGAGELGLGSPESDVIGDELAEPMDDGDPGGPRQVEEAPLPVDELDAATTSSGTDGPAHATAPGPDSPGSGPTPTGAPTGAAGAGASAGSAKGAGASGGAGPSGGSSSGGGGAGSGGAARPAADPGSGQTTEPAPAPESGSAPRPAPGPSSTRGGRSSPGAGGGGPNPFGNR
jgi:hypothetical protein